MGRVSPQDIIRLYKTGNKKLRYSLEASVEEARQFTPSTISFLKIFVNTFTQIRFLYLPHCNLTELPAGMFLPQTLRILDLSENNLTDGKLPQVVLELSQLEELNLVDCYLSELPADMSSLQFLRRLNLAGNRFMDANYIAGLRLQYPRIEIEF